MDHHIFWKTKEWWKGKRQYPTPAIKRPNQADSITQSEKCDALWDALLPEMEPPWEEDFPALDVPAEGEMTSPDLTPIELDGVIQGAKQNSAPSPDCVLFKAIRWTWQVCPDPIHLLYAWCLRIGYHPRCWRVATSVAVRKPNKPDYTNLRAYRLIALLPCWSKVLEKVVTQQLGFLAAHHHLTVPIWGPAREVHH